MDALLGTVAQRHGLPFVSVGDWLTRYNLTGSMADGVHLNSQGHAAWAPSSASGWSRWDLTSGPRHSLAPVPLAPDRTPPAPADNRDPGPEPTRNRVQDQAKEPVPAPWGGHRLLCRL